MSAISACLLAVAIAMEVAREICFKLAANQRHRQRHYLLRLLGTSWTWAGIACWAVELVAWIRVLSMVPLSIAFPLMSLCYCGMVLAGKILLHERVGRRKALGLLFITMGVAIIGAHGVG